MRFLAHSFLGRAKLGIGRILGLLKVLLRLVLTDGINLNHFTWMSTYHIGQVVVRVFAEIVLLLIRIQVLEVEVLELGEVFDIKVEAYFGPFFSVGYSLF